MSLLYKDDWDQAKQRYKAWWAHDNVGRCGLSVTAPRKDAPDIPEPSRPETPDQCWHDLDYRSALSEYRNARTFFGAEAFPVWDYGYPGNKRLAAFLGCPVSLDFHTGWLEPILTGEDLEYRSLRLDEGNPRWQFARRRSRRASASRRSARSGDVGTRSPHSAGPTGSCTT